MKVPCSYRECGKRRMHHERPDEERGVQYVDVPDDFSSGRPTYCSYECAAYDRTGILKASTVSVITSREMSKIDHVNSLERISPNPRFEENNDNE